MRGRDRIGGRIYNENAVAIGSFKRCCRPECEGSHVVSSPRFRLHESAKSVKMTLLQWDSGIRGAAAEEFQIPDFDPHPDACNSCGGQ